MLPQPPSGVEASTVSKAAVVSRRKWSWFLGGGVASILIVLLALLILRKRIICDQTEEVSNARQVGIALFEFQQEYGKFPDEDTITAVRTATSSNLNLGKQSSNDFFRQLLASGIASSEAMFYAKGEGVKKADNVFTASEALKNGECGFTYLLGATGTDKPSRPLVVAPMIPGTDRFDPKPFKGKAVMLRMDNSAGSYRIDENGHVNVDGRNVLDPHHPIWDGHAPVIAWPEL